MPTFGWSLRSGALVLAVCAACAARTGDHVARPSGAEGFVALPDGGKLYYETKGSGPAVVLIHGGQLDRRMWDGLFDTLSHAHRVIRYDVRGFGRSPPGQGDFRSYEDLGALLDSLGIKHVSIVGLSLGGRIAVDFALAHPDRVERLVLLAPGVSGFPWSRGDSAWEAAMERAVQERDTVAVTDLWLRSTYMAPAMENPALAPRLRELSLANSGAFLRPRMGRELEPHAFGRLRELRPPALVAVGTRDDPDIRTIVDSIAAQARHARKLVLPGAGHMLNMERPAEVTRAVIDFLDGQERRPAPAREVVEGRTTITLPDTARYSAAARAIVRLERRRSAAIAAHDTAWLATLYAPDFHGVAADGRRIDRPALFHIFTLGDSSAHFLIDEVEVRELAPNTATVTGRLRMVTAGRSAGAGSRYLHVYVRKGGRWRILAAEGTAVTAAPSSGPAPAPRSRGGTARETRRFGAASAAVRGVIRSSELRRRQPDGA